MIVTPTNPKNSRSIMLINIDSIIDTTSNLIAKAMEYVLVAIHSAYTYFVWQL